MELNYLIRLNARGSYLKIKLIDKKGFIEVGLELVLEVFRLNRKKEGVLK